MNAEQKRRRRRRRTASAFVHSLLVTTSSTFFSSSCIEHQREHKNTQFLSLFFFFRSLHTITLTFMSERAISVSQPLNDENNYDNLNFDEPVTNNVSRSRTRATSFQRFIQMFFYLFSDCLFARILAFTFICQAAVMWLGTALNFILQLLFIPFSFSASSKPDALPSSNIYSFLGSYSMIPGIVAFSAHYFWFVLQIGCHCFTVTLRMFDFCPRKFLFILYFKEIKNPIIELMPYYFSSTMKSYSFMSMSNNCIDYLLVSHRLLM